MSALDKEIRGVTLYHQDTKVELGHVFHLWHEEMGDCVGWFIRPHEQQAFVLPARAATELAIAMLAIAQGVNARGMPRVAANLERQVLEGLLDALEKSPEEQAEAVRLARATLDDLKRDDEEGEVAS